MKKEFELLISHNIDYVVEDGTIIITEKNKHIHIPFIANGLRDIQFNNRGFISLHHLTKIGDNVQFNNSGRIDLGFCGLQNMPNALMNLC